VIRNHFPKPIKHLTQAARVLFKHAPRFSGPRDLFDSSFLTPVRIVTQPICLTERPYFGATVVQVIGEDQAARWRLASQSASVRRTQPINLLNEQDVPSQASASNRRSSGLSSLEPDSFSTQVSTIRKPRSAGFELRIPMISPGSRVPVRWSEIALT